MKKIVKFIIVAAISCAALAITAFASDSCISTGTVNTSSGLRLRSEASTSGTVLTIIPYGASVDVYEDNGSWYNIRYGGQAGYCSAEYIDVSQPDDIISGFVTASVLNLRSGPSTAEPIVDKLSCGTPVIIAGEEDNWYYISCDSGASGYVYSEYIMLSSNFSADSDEATALVGYALGYVGSSYSYGGTGPTSFDCSGFSQYIYSHFGYSICRTAGGQMSSGTGISKEYLQPGDLVFFSDSSSGYITHVAIYIGSGQIVHANTPSTGVIVSDLSESYYVRTYAGACRVLTN